MASYLLALVFWDFPKLRSPLILADLIFPLLFLATVVRAGWNREWNRSLDRKSCLLLLAYPAATLLPHLGDTRPLEAVKTLYLVGIALTVRAFVVDEGRADFVRRFLFLSALLAALSGVLGALSFYVGFDDDHSNPLLSKYGSMPPGPYPRVNGLFINANMLCNFLLIGVCFAWEMKRDHRGRSPALALLLICALLTFSPGLGAMAWVYGYRNCGWRKGVAYVVALLIIVINIVSFSGLAKGHFQPSTRALCWQATVRAWSERPILGHGIGHPLVRVVDVTPSGTQMQNDPHNTILSVLGHTGLIGFLAFLFLTLPILRGDYTPLKGAFFAGMFWQGCFGSFEETRHLWMLLGVLLAARVLRRSED